MDAEPEGDENEIDLDDEDEGGGATGGNKRRAQEKKTKKARNRWGAGAQHACVVKACMHAYMHAHLLVWVTACARAGVRGIMHACVGAGLRGVYTKGVEVPIVELRDAGGPCVRGGSARVDGGAAVAAMPVTSLSSSCLPHGRT